VDRNGEAVANGESGEIVVRGPQVMKGYWNNEEATADTIRKGWLHTGDMGTLDDNGYLTIVGRLKDLIISGGENIYPAEIEKVLEVHEAIKEVTVIGVADLKWGEVPLAVVVSQEGVAPSQSAVVDWCKQNLASYKVPAHFEFIDVLPRNPSGKILKQQLRDEIGKNYE
jgi:acyl-CoA synthetase (AMP-forming)/AMP-acid ligase II